MTEIISVNALSTPQPASRVACGTLYPTGWVPPTEMTYEQWETQGIIFQELQECLPFVLGDWLNAGEKRYGETYTQALLRSDKSLETLQQYKWVMGAIPPERRYPNGSGITYTHHRHVAKKELSPAEQDWWLKQAHDNEWTSARLKQELDASLTKKMAIISTRGSDVVPNKLGTQATPEQAAIFLSFHYDREWISELLEKIAALP
jgi:hypothetical protein